MLLAARLPDGESESHRAATSRAMQPPRAGQAGKTLLAFPKPPRGFTSFVTGAMIDGDGLCRRSSVPRRSSRGRTPTGDMDLSFFFQNAPDKAACLALRKRADVDGSSCQPDRVLSCYGRAVREGGSQRGASAILAGGGRAGTTCGLSPQAVRRRGAGTPTPMRSAGSIHKAMVACTPGPAGRPRPGGAIDRLLRRCGRFFLRRARGQSCPPTPIATAPS